MKTIQHHIEKEYLTRLFLEGVEQRLVRKGSGARGSLVRKHRILRGVMPRQLADVSGYAKADILLIERGLRDVSASEERRLVKLVDHKLRWRHPLVRGFGMVIFEKWHSLHHFWEEQFQDDFSYSIVTRNFQQLNGRGYRFPWTTVSRYLNVAGVGVSDPRRTFLQQLFQRKDDVTDAINHDNGPALLAVIRQVLKRWRTEVRAAKGDPQSIEHTLGLTTEERGRKA